VSDVSQFGSSWNDPNDQYAKTLEDMHPGGKPIGPSDDDSWPYLHQFDPPGGPV